VKRKELAKRKEKYRRVSVGSSSDIGIVGEDELPLGGGGGQSVIQPCHAQIAMGDIARTIKGMRFRRQI